MAKTNRIEKKGLQWLAANCPICGKEYQYLPNYKPKIAVRW